jgi:hypothetical protein
MPAGGGAAVGNGDALGSEEGVGIALAGALADAVGGAPAAF